MSIATVEKKNATVTKRDGSVYEYDNNGTKRFVKRTMTRIESITNSDCSYYQGYMIIVAVEEWWSKDGVLEEERYTTEDTALIERIKNYTEKTGDTSWIFTSKRTGRTFYRTAWFRTYADGYGNEASSFEEAERNWLKNN